MRIYNKKFRKQRVGKNLTTLLSVFLLQLSVASCGLDLGKNTDANNAATNSEKKRKLFLLDRALERLQVLWEQQIQDLAKV